MALAIEMYILFTAFMIIYGAFLFYEVFKRGDNKGQYAYIMALLPANYLWYILTINPSNWGPMGAMFFLAILWIACVIRDIFLKDAKKGIKDADDVALFLILGLVIQLILSAILPVIVESMKTGTSAVWGFLYLPEFNPNNPGFAEAAWLPYRIAATTLVLLVIIPIILDLRNAKVGLVGIVIMVGIFALPFYFLAFLWLMEAPWAMFFLFMVLFFVLLLVLTRSK
jgi:hypothetical protein